MTTTSHFTLLNLTVQLHNLIASTPRKQKTVLSLCTSVDKKETVNSNVKKMQIYDMLIILPFFLHRVRDM